MVEQRQVEVAGDGEDVADADLHEAAGEVAAERSLGGVERHGGGLDGRDGAVRREAADVVTRGGLARVQRS